MSTVNLQAALQQKDVELEHRAGLLLKTKVAIEQLQDELSSSRRELDRWRRVANRQGGDLEDSQRRVQALEAELEAKAREGSALLADTLALKRQLQDAQDSLLSALEGKTAQHAAFLEKLGDMERAAASAKADCQAALEQVAQQGAERAKAVASVAEREQALADKTAALGRLEQQHQLLEGQTSRQRAQLEALNAQLVQVREAAAAAELAQGQLEGRVMQSEAHSAKEAEARRQAEKAAADAAETFAEEQSRHRLHASLWEQRFRELQQEAVQQLDAREAAWAQRLQEQQSMASAVVEETRRQLTKRLYVAEGDWARKLQQGSAEWAAKLDTARSEWLRRCEADKASWDSERSRLAEEARQRAVEVEHAAAAALQDVQQHYRCRLAAAEAKGKAGAQAAERVSEQRLLEAAARSKAEARAALECQAAAASQREQQLLVQLASEKEQAAASLADMDRQWAVKLAAVQEQCNREKLELERSWAAQLRDARSRADESQAALRAQVDAHLATVTQRVSAMVQRDSRKEKERAKLLRLVAKLEAGGEGEQERRHEAEEELREASAAFQRQLAGKGHETDLLRQEIRFLRGWMASEPPVTPPHTLCKLSAGPATATVTHRCPARCVAPAVEAGWPACAYGAASHAAQARCPCAPACPVHSVAAAAAQAAEVEVQALRSARRAYRRAA